MPANDYLLTKKDIYKKKFKELDRKIISLLNSIKINLLNKKELKEFVDLHQGKIWVESEEGKGSTFLVLLPVEDSL